jgi:hypothetical protein
MSPKQAKAINLSKKPRQSLQQANLSNKPFPQPANLSNKPRLSISPASQGYQSFAKAPLPNTTGDAKQV